jgi:hypothetical protein
VAVDLESLYHAARGLMTTPLRPSFLGSGSFGGTFGGWGGSD